MPPPPPPVRVNTVTWAVPAVAISAAEIAAFTPVVPTNIVVRLLPFHWTTEHGAKPVPLAVSRNAAAPAVALAGESELIAGVGSGVVGVVIVKVRELELVVELDTEMVATPGKAVSVAEIAAVSCVALT